MSLQFARLHKGLSALPADVYPRAVRVEVLPHRRGVTEGLSAAQLGADHTAGTAVSPSSSARSPCCRRRASHVDLDAGGRRSRSGGGRASRGPHGGPSLIGWCEETVGDACRCIVGGDGVAVETGCGDGDDLPTGVAA